MRARLRACLRACDSTRPIDERVVRHFPLSPLDAHTHTHTHTHGHTRYFENADVDRTNVGSIETAIMRCDTSDSALARYEPLVAALEEMASQVDESHVAHAEMTENSAAAREAHTAVTGQCAEFRDGLNSDLAKEKELLETAKKYRIAAADFLLDVDELTESTLEPVEGAARCVLCL